MPTVLARRVAQVGGNGIPQYFLYGETPADVDERFLHVESIAERSRLHDWTIRPHAHRELQHLLLVRRGGGRYRVESRVHEIAAVSLVNVPRSSVHGFEFTPGTDGWVITASGALLERLARDHGELADVLREPLVLTLAGNARRRLCSLFEALVTEFRGSLPSRRAAAEAWLLAILVHARRSSFARVEERSLPYDRDSELAARYRALIEKRYRTTARVADYARALCVSSERLRRACVRSAASSPLALLNARRLLEAKRSLRYTNLTVALVAESCGFLDPAYFSRFFTRQTGCSPRRYRAEHGNA